MSVKGRKENSFIVTTKEMSEILGLSDRRIRQLENEGALVKITHGKFDLSASIRAYIDYLNDDTEEELNKTEEEALWTRARRQKAELELKQIEGELHRAEDVKVLMTDMILTAKSKLQAIPARIALQLENEPAVVIEKTIAKEINEALKSLASYNPKEFV